MDSWCTSVLATGNVNKAFYALTDHVWITRIVDAQAFPRMLPGGLESLKKVSSRYGNNALIDPAAIKFISPTGQTFKPCPKKHGTVWLMNPNR
jgi:hypothetical protein